MHEPQPDLSALFRRAFQILDNDETESETTIRIRARIAELAQQLGLADALGGGLRRAIAADVQLFRDRLRPEQQEEMDRLAELNQTSKRLLLEGDQQRAEEILRHAQLSMPATWTAPLADLDLACPFRPRRIVLSLTGIPSRLISRSEGRPPTL